MPNLTFKQVKRLYKERAEELREQSEGLDKDSRELLYELDDDYNNYKRHYLSGQHLIALLNNIGEKIDENYPGHYIAIADALSSYDGSEDSYVYYEEEGVYNGELSYEANLVVETLDCDYLDRLEELSDIEKVEDFIYCRTEYCGADEDYVYDYNVYYIRDSLRDLSEDIESYQDLDNIILRCKDYEASAEAIENRVRTTIRDEREKLQEALDELYKKEAENDR